MRNLKLTPPGIVLGLLCIMYMILYIDRVNIATAAPAIKSDLVLSNAELGFAFSAFAYPYAAFQLFGGMLGYRFGARRMLCVSIFVVCIATALTGTAGGLASLFAARVLLGLGEGAALPTATHAISNWLPASRWGFAQGITHSFARLGNFATPPIVAALIAISSWRVSFFILACASAIWMALWASYFRDSPEQHPRMRADDLARLPRRQIALERPPVPFFPLLKRMLPATAVNFCYGWILWLFLNWIPSFFVQSYHLDLQSSALFSSGVFLGGVMGDTSGGILSDAILRRTGSVVLARRSVIIVGFIGAGLFLVPVILMHNLAVAAISLSLAFFFAEIIVAPIWAAPMDIAPRYAGSAAGMMNFGSAFAGIVSPPVFGSMLDLTGTWTIPFVAVVAVLGTGALLTLYLDPGQPFETPGEAAIAAPRPA